MRSLNSSLVRTARRIIDVQRHRSIDRALAAPLRAGRGTRVALNHLNVRAPGYVGIGTTTNVEGSLVIERAGASVEIGSRVHIGGSSILDASESIVVGDDVLIGFGVLIMDHDSHSLRYTQRSSDVTSWMGGCKNWNHVLRTPVVIRDKAWIGARATILKGVDVGEGAIGAACSVVTKDVPPWTLVAGNPARSIREVEP